MFKLNRNNESGRSMVEMLGVLAIIGVLSIGGIAGYTTAIRSHRANEIVNAISMLYVSGKSLNEGSGTGTMTYEALGSWPEGSSNISYTDGIITATISEQDICKQVLGKLGSLVTAGDCSAASGPYVLTMTMGEAKEAADEAFDYDPDRDDGNCILGTYKEDFDCQILICKDDGYYGSLDTTLCCEDGSDGKIHTTIDGLCTNRTIY